MRMLNILVVDDHEENLNLIKEILSPYYNTFCFTSYLDCETFLLSNSIDIRYVCMDYYLGDKNNGLIYIKKIREILNKEVPFSLISGAVNIDHNLFLSIKRSHFIQKPYEPEDLLLKIKQHINNEELVSNEQLGSEIEHLEKNT